MISLFASVILLFNVESSYNSKEEVSSIKKTAQIIKTIHGLKWGVQMKYLIIFLFLILLGCENVKQSIGITTKPLQSGEQLENSTKLNYKIIFGKIRPKEDED